MRVTISPKFFFSDRTNNVGDNILYCRLIIDRKKSDFSTGIYTSKNDWNEQFNRSEKNQQINIKLSAFEAKLQEIVDKLYFDNKEITARLIKEIYSWKNEGKYTITEYIDYYLYDKGQIDILAKGYSNKFITLQRYLERFTKEKYNTSVFDMRSIDFKFLSDFDIFMKSMISKQYKRPLTQVYINKMHSMFRTLTISAHKEGTIKFLPYKDFKIKKIQTEIKYLTIDELSRLRHLDFSHNHSLDKVKDIFLFSVYTGLRYTDAQQIRDTDIEYVNGEPKYLITYQKKTKDKVEIPILNPTLEIIKKYENSGLRIETGRLIPQLSNSKLNEYLKVIGDLAYIKLKLSAHIARHTCATTVLLENNVPLNEVSKWLGHREMKSTRVYAHVTRNKLGNTAERLDLLIS